MGRCTTTFVCGPIGVFRKGHSESILDFKRPMRGKCRPLSTRTAINRFSDIDGSLITNKLWGIYYKPDFHFGRRTRGRHALSDRDGSGPGKGRSLRPPHPPISSWESSLLRCGVSALAFCQKRFEGKFNHYKKEPSGGIGAFTFYADSFPVFDVYHENCYIIADSNHGYKMIGWASWLRRNHGRNVAACWTHSDSRDTRKASCTRCRRARSRGVKIREFAMTDLEAHVQAEGRNELVQKVRAKNRRIGYYLYLLPVHFGSRDASSAKGFPPTTGSRPPSVASSLFTVRRQTSSWTASKTISATAPEASELVGIPDPEPLCNYPGISAWGVSSVPSFVTAKRGKIRVVISLRTVEANLQRIHEEFSQDHQGLHLRHGAEPGDDLV